jgi:hypothetical protein
VVPPFQRSSFWFQSSSVLSDRQTGSPISDRRSEPIRCDSDARSMSGDRTVLSSSQCCRFVSRFLSILDLAWVENRGEFRWLRQCSQIGTGETAETGQLWGSSCPTIEAPDGIRIRQFGIQAARSQVGSRGSGRVCVCPWFCRGRLRGSQALGGPPSRPGEPCRERATRSETALAVAAVSHLVPVVGNFPIRIWHPPPTSDLPSGTDLHTAGSARLLEQIGLSVPTHFLGRFHPVLVTFRPKLLLVE